MKELASADRRVMLRPRRTDHGRRCLRVLQGYPGPERRTYTRRKIFLGRRKTK